MDKSSYRIIDANFNRCREGLRLAEEICRFSLNDSALTAECKSLRHRLSGIASGIGTDRLVSCRDTAGDVGCGMSVSGQMCRGGMSDCLAAAFSRITEALRVIGEVTAPYDKNLASVAEQMRYSAYSLQKRIITLAVPAEKFREVRLYCLVNCGAQIDALSLTGRLARSGADCIQLRAKGISDRRLFDLAKEFVQTCRENGVISIINDRVDIACAAGADGVHLGRQDLSVSLCRDIQTRPLIIGTSTHNSAELAQAIAERPSYIAVGSVFPSETKSTAAVCGLEFLSRAKKLCDKESIPLTAIGGINQHNIAEVVSLGVNTVAISSASAQNPETACKGLKESLAG